MRLSEVPHKAFPNRSLIFPISLYPIPLRALLIALKLFYISSFLFIWQICSKYKLFADTVLNFRQNTLKKADMCLSSRNFQSNKKQTHR